MPGQLDALVDSFLDHEMREQPTLATSWGMPGREELDSELGDFDAGAFERRSRADASWAERFAALGDGDLGFDERIDRDLVLSTLRGRLVMADWQVWRRDPATYLGPSLSGVFALFLHRLRPDRELAAAAAARLRQVPAVLASARANLDPSLAARVFVERAVGQAHAGVTYARTLVPAEVAEDAGRPELAAAGEEAAAAFASFAAWLQDLAPRCEGDHAIGEDRYSALLREKELLGYGASEMRERGRVAWAELDAELTELARAVDVGAPSWRDVVERLNEDHPPTPEAMREEYEHWTGRARRFLLESGLATMPDGEQCVVEPSPPFQRPVIAVASYMPPPPFRDSRLGHFFVPYPPEGTPPDEVQQRLATNSRASIPTVAVHEAYPGHHWHLVAMQAVARPVRRVLRTAYFAEGWALYAERLFREHGFFTDPRHELAHLDARIFRAARIVVDTSLHIGDMGFEEAVEFMRTRASLSEATARAEVGRYCTWPTQASSYLTGCLEIERVRAEYLRDGRGDLRSFNDRIARSGSLPIALAERAVRGEETP